MKPIYTLYYIASFFMGCLLLESCSGFTNVPLDDVRKQEELEEHFDMQAILDKEFVVQGGTRVTFYAHNGNLQASIEMAGEKYKVYNGVPVVIEEGTDLLGLSQLPEKLQKNRIQVQFDKKRKPISTTLHKPWLMGGMKVGDEEEAELEGENELDNESIPNECFCPITQELMEDPVIAQDGHTYERSAIQAWFNKGGAIGPKTGAALPNTNLLPNYAMRSLIQDMKAQIPILAKHKLNMHNIEVAAKLKEKELEEKNRIIGQLEQQLSQAKNVNQPANDAIANEVVVFIGNPGVGKSTLCNSILGKAVANSGLSFGTGMTTHKQAYIHEGKLYIDTPGLDDIEEEIRIQAAREIEKALKHNNNYKIVFVATLENGRIRPSDLVTINVVCDAIKVKFEYGLIFNQIPNQAMQQIEQASKNKEMVSKYLSTLHQQPSSIIFLEKVNQMEAVDNIYFEENHENRQKLLTFLNGLHANKIEEYQIDRIDINNYQKRINEVEMRNKKIIIGLQKMIETQQQEIKELKGKNKDCKLY